MSARLPYPRTARVRAALATSGVALLLTGCSLGPPEPDPAGEPPNLPTPSASTGNPEQQVVATVLAKGLRVPWGMAFLPDGAALVTERDSGRILKVGPESGPQGLTVTPAQTVPGVAASGEAGLLGVAVSPAYAQDRSVFVYFTTDRTTGWSGCRSTAGDRPTPILDRHPQGRQPQRRPARVRPGRHALRQHRRRRRPRAAQDRAEPRRQDPADAPPTAAGAGQPVRRLAGLVSSGHRNVQGIAWDAAGRMFATEFGQNTWDEINRIDPGANYGWPTVEGAGGDSGSSTRSSVGHRRGLPLGLAVDGPAVGRGLRCAGSGSGGWSSPTAASCSARPGSC